MQSVQFSNLTICTFYLNKVMYKNMLQLAHAGACTKLKLKSLELATFTETTMIVIAKYCHFTKEIVSWRVRNSDVREMIVKNIF